MRQTVQFPVKGMHCETCADKLHRALDSLPGVLELKVSLQDGSVRIVFEPSEIHINQLDATIRQVGFNTPPGCP